MKEQLILLNQAQIVPSRDLTAKANPYTLESGMNNDKGEGPKPSIGEARPEVRPSGQRLIQEEYREHGIKGLAELVGMAREKGVGAEGIQALQALLQEGANQEQMQRALQEAAGETDDSRIQEIRGKIEREKLSDVEVRAQMPGDEDYEDEAEEVGGRIRPDQRIDTRGIQDRIIRGIVEDYNNRPKINPLQELSDAEIEISKRLREVDLSPEDMTRAVEIQSQLRSILAHEINTRSGQAEAEHIKRSRQSPEIYFTQRELDAILDNEDRREEVFNSIFKRADVNPTQEFNNVFSAFYDQPVYTAFIDWLQANGKYPEANKFQLERQMRESAHNANYVVLQNIGSEQFVGFAQGLRNEHVDYAFRLKGVTQAMHAFEQAFLKVREENGGFIPPEDVMDDPKTGKRGKVETLARGYLIREIRQGLLEEKDSEGKVIGGIFHDVDDNDWRVNRAIAISRGMGLLTGRIIEIAASSIIPEGNKYISLYAQKIIADLAPFRHLVGKFNIARDKNKIFTLLLNRNKLKPWQYKELKEMTDDELMLQVANGLGEADKKGNDRLLAQLNPFGVGGVFSVSTWRTATDDIEAGTTGSMKLKGEENRIGTGVIIEANRRDLSPKKTPKERKKARENIEAQLNVIEETQPLKLFFNMRGGIDKGGNSVGLQGQVLRELGYEIDKDGFEAYIKAQAGGDKEKEKKLMSEERGKIKYYPQLQEYIDELIVLQEKYLVDVKRFRDARARGEEVKEEDNPELKGLDFTSITDSDMTQGEVEEKRNRVRRLASKIKDKFNHGRDSEGRTFREGFIEDLAEKPWRIPFNFGTEDVPYDEYEFTKLGSNAIARRWGDFGNENKAVAATLELMNNMHAYKTPEQVAEALHKIYSPIDQYDPGVAAEITSRLAEGVAKFYSKDYISRLPFGMGTILGLRGKNSFAEAAWGRGATSWDENEVNKFTRLLRAKGILSLEGQRELQSRTIGGRMDITKAFFRNYAQLGLFAVLFYIIKNSVRETK